MRKSLLSLAMTLVPALSFAQQHLTFCYDPYPPYTFGTEGPATGGLTVTLLQAVVDRVDGVTASVVLMPWKRCQAQARDGKVDGILPLFISQERESYLAFTREVYSQTSGYWYVRGGRINQQLADMPLAEFAKFQLGMLNGGMINEQSERMFSSNNDIVRARDVSSLFRILLKDRVDVIALDNAVGRFISVENGWSEIVTSLDPPISTRPAHFGLSKSSGADAHLDAFNDAIAALAADGIIEGVMGSTDYPARR